MTIAASLLVVVLLPCRADSDNTQICEIYKNILEYDDFWHIYCLRFACFGLLLACFVWRASCFLLAVLLHRRGVSARLSCSVWPASGSLSWACVVWVWPAVPGPRQNIVYC